MFYKTNTTTDLQKLFSMNTLVVPMYNMGKVTYRKIIHFLNFFIQTLRGVELCVTLQILTKEIVAVAFHEST